MPIYEVALGVYYQSSYYIAKRPVYKAETVHFDRFCYDFISLFGVNILFLEIEHLEQIIRKVYSCVSFNFSDNELKEKQRQENKEQKGGSAPAAAALGSGTSMGIQLRALECVEVAFTYDEFSAAQKKEEHVKIEVLNRRKTSEDDFIEKVKQEKDKVAEAQNATGGMATAGAAERTNVEVTSQSQAGDRGPADGGKDDADAASKESVFGKMKTLEEVAAEQQAKKEEKRRLLTELKVKRENMRPLVVFTGVKDNPLPYEQKYLRSQHQTKEKEALKLPEIKEKQRGQRLNRSLLNKTVEAKSPAMKALPGPGRFRSPEAPAAGLNPLHIMPSLKSALTKGSAAKPADPAAADLGAASGTPAPRPSIPIHFNALDRSPVRPRVKNLKEMQHKDVRRYQIFKQYSMLHEFTV